MAEKRIVIDIDVNNSEANNSVRETISTMGKLRNELADLTLQLEDVEKGSDAFKNLQSEIAKTQKKIESAEGAFGEATDRIRTLSGSGVERATASFGLLREGITNLDFGKFSVGLKGVTGSFKALGSAIAATGIGLLVIAVTQLIQNFDELKNAGGLVGQVFTTIGNIIGGVLDTLEDIADTIGLIDKEEQKNAAAREKRAKDFLDQELNKRNALKERFDSEIALAKSLGKSTEELEKQSLAGQKATVDAQIARIESFRQISTQFDSVLLPLLKKFREESEQIALDIEIKENESFVKRNENYKKLLNDRKSFLDKFRIEDNLQRLNREQEEALAEAERLKVSEEEKLRIRQFFSIKREELIDAENQKAEEERLKKEEKEKAEAEKKAADAQAARDAELEAIKKSNAEIEAENQRRRKDEAAAEQQFQQLKADAVLTGLNFISSISETFAKNNEASQRKAFNIQKGVAIATATIETYLAAQQAYRSQTAIPTPDAPIRGAIAAGIAVASGLARVAKIAATKFQSSGSGAGSGAGDGGGRISPSTIQSSSQTNAVEGQTPNSFALFGTAGGANNLGFPQPQPIQAFVVESQITSTQQTINKIKLASEL